jgi:hypothetical protein
MPQALNMPVKRSLIQSRRKVGSEIFRSWNEFLIYCQPSRMGTSPLASLKGYTLLNVMKGFNRLSLVIRAECIHRTQGLEEHPCIKQKADGECKVIHRSLDAKERA